jgi:tetratricopeptide (TPR) repeat protein
LRSGIVMEGMGLLELAANRPAEALECFNRARRFYKNPEDILRVTIHEVLRLRALGREPEALTLTRKQLALYGSSPAAELLRTFERQMAPPVSAPAATQAAPATR